MPKHFVNICFFPLIVSRIYERKDATGDDEEIIKLFNDDNQHIGWNTDNNEGEMQTPPMKKNKNRLNQGIYKCKSQLLLINTIEKKVMIMTLLILLTKYERNTLKRVYFLN